MDGRVRRILDGKEHRDGVAQATFAERRVELGQHRDFESFGEFLDGRHCRASRGPEQQDLAVECPGCECFQYFAGLDRAGRQTEDDEIGPLGIEHRGPTPQRARIRK